MQASQIWLHSTGTIVFPAQKLRTIFVAERRSARVVHGPNEVGAAMAMGNSPAMWDRMHARSFRRREMQTCSCGGKVLLAATTQMH